MTGQTANLQHRVGGTSSPRDNVGNGTSIAQQRIMNRQWKGVAALASAFVVAFIVALALHSPVAAVTVLLATLVVSFVLGISWMRTAPMHRARRKQTSLP